MDGQIISVNGGILSVKMLGWIGRHKSLYHTSPCWKTRMLGKKNG